jgi:hypothetical protein
LLFFFKEVAMWKIAIPARRTWLRILAFALCALPMYGQTADTGAIAGSVSDPSGASVGGAAALVIDSEATREERNLTTDAEGNFSVPFLTPGNYDIPQINVLGALVLGNRRATMAEPRTTTSMSRTSCSYRVESTTFEWARKSTEINTTYEAIFRPVK